MKKIILGMSVISSLLVSDEISQYEALQKLNLVSGKLILENEQIKKELESINKLLKLKGSNQNIKVLDGQIDFNGQVVNVLVENEIFKRLEKIEKRLNIGVEETIVENIILEKKQNIKKFKVSTKLLNVREEPTLNSNIIDQYKLNMTIEGIDLNNGWIKLKNQNLYLSRIYLTEIK
jgi:hypothetical protein